MGEPWTTLIESGLQAIAEGHTGHSPTDLHKWLAANGFPLSLYMFRGHARSCLGELYERAKRT